MQQPDTHQTYRSGDTVYCRKCGKSWDVADTDIPVCKPVSKQREKYLEFVKPMRTKR